MAKDKSTNFLIAVFENIPGILLVMLILGCIAFRILHGPIGDDGIWVWHF